MASPVLQIINSVVMTNAAALLYTSPVLTWTEVLKVTASNTDSATHTVTFYLVPSGGSAGTSTLITPPQSILAGSVFNDPNLYGQVLNPGDAIWGLADAGSVVNVFASGLQVTS